MSSEHPIRLATGSTAGSTIIGRILPARIEQARDRLRDEAKHFAHVFGDDSRTCVQLRDIADELGEIARLQREGE